MGGIGALGFISLGAGFLKSKIPLIVLRALGGIGNYCFLPANPCRNPFHTTCTIFSINYICIIFLLISKSFQLVR